MRIGTAEFVGGALLGGYTEMPWSTCGKPKAFYNADKKDYKMYSWTKGLTFEPLIEEPIGTWFENQVVCVFRYLVV